MASHSPSSALLDRSLHRLPEDFGSRFLSPSLVIFLDAVRANVGRVLAAAGGPARWRPHVKTTKVRAGFRVLLDHGLQNFKCATTREALHLAAEARAAGKEIDVLVAYPLIGPALGRMDAIASEYPEHRFSVLCEDAGAGAAIPGSLSIFVDVNLGMDRTGVPIAEAAQIEAIARAAGERLRGLHAYDGHLYTTDPEERERQAFGCYEGLLELDRNLRTMGLVAEEWITSGTPTFQAALRFPGFVEPPTGTVHRISPGTVAYHDARSDEQNPDFPLTPAAVVFARVVSHPTPGRITVDAGSKALAAEAGDPCAVVLDHPELVAQTPSEEHLPLGFPADQDPLPRGTELLLVPRHVCPTVNLAEEAVLIEDGRVRDIVPVHARAHDLLA